MLKIRMSRKGKKKKPFYQILVTDERNSINGNFIEKLGFFDPFPVKHQSQKCQLNIDRIKYWLANGAKCSKRVQSLISNYNHK